MMLNDVSVSKLMREVLEHELSIVGALDRVCGKTGVFWDLPGSDDCIEDGDEDNIWDGGKIEVA